MAYQFPLMSEQKHRQSASDLQQEEQGSPDPSVRRDRDTILRSATNHEEWEAFTLRQNNLVQPNSDKNIEIKSQIISETKKYVRFSRTE